MLLYYYEFYRTIVILLGTWEYSHEIIGTWVYMREYVSKWYVYFYQVQLICCVLIVLTLLLMIRMRRKGLCSEAVLVFFLLPLFLPLFSLYLNLFFYGSVHWFGLLLIVYLIYFFSALTVFLFSIMVKLFLMC